MPGTPVFISPSRGWKVQLWRETKWRKPHSPCDATRLRCGSRDKQTSWHETSEEAKHLSGLRWLWSRGRDIVSLHTTLPHNKGICMTEAGKRNVGVASSGLMLMSWPQGSWLCFKMCNQDPLIFSVTVNHSERFRPLVFLLPSWRTAGFLGLFLQSVKNLGRGSNQINWHAQRDLPKWMWVAAAAFGLNIAARQTGISLAKVPPRKDPLSDTRLFVFIFLGRKQKWLESLIWVGPKRHDSTYCNSHMPFLLCDFLWTTSVHIFYVMLCRLISYYTILQQGI